MRYYSRSAAGVSYLAKRGTVVPNTATGMVLGDVFVRFVRIGDMGVFDSTSLRDDEGQPLLPEQCKAIEKWVEERGAKGLFGKEFYKDGEPYLNLKLKYGSAEVEELAKQLRQEAIATAVKE